MGCLLLDWVDSSCRNVRDCTDTCTAGVYLRCLGLDLAHEDVLGIRQLVLVEGVVLNCRSNTTNPRVRLILVCPR